MERPPGNRGIFCNRTLNFRAIRAIGYDMDYTLIHYHVAAWEQRAYEYLREHFLREGWPVQDLKFDPNLVCRGLIIDIEHGNLVKANRFGFIKRSMHGTVLLDYEQQREIYSRTIVDLSERRWVFLNTLFSLSEGCIYAQLVDLLDQRQVPEVLGYSDLYARVRDALSEAHMEGRLKNEIISAPEKFVELEPDNPLALLDQKKAGKKLLLITNSEWTYAAPMMDYAFNRFLPGQMTWRELFDVIIIGARKPEFFTEKNLLFEVVDEQGHLLPVGRGLEAGKFYLGGSAREVERHLGVTGDEILYVGDHMFGDVRVTKNVLRWRTALILRELEDEIEAAQSFYASEVKLAELMEKKEKLEARYSHLRLQLQRKKEGYGGAVRTSESSIHHEIQKIREKLQGLDEQLAPLAKQASELYNPIWGLLMRAGNDKSHLAFQIERFADIYTSRVGNFLEATPFIYLRSPRGSLPHDPAMSGGRPHAGGVIS